MSKVVSLRLRDDQVERLQRAARQLGRSPSETAALLLEEALRERDFAFIEFRDSPVGRQAYIMGTRLTVWMVVWLARDFGGDAAKVAEHLEVPVNQIGAALRYAAAYPLEIDDALKDFERMQDVEVLRQYIPNLEVVTIDTDSPDADSA